MVPLGVGVTVKTPCLVVATECGNQASDKTVKVLWSNVDMRRVVLRADSYAYGFSCLRTLGKRTDVERSDRETERQN